MNEFLRDPTWFKVHSSFVLGTLGLLVLIMRHLIRRHGRKRDILTPAVLLFADHSQNEHEAEEIEGLHEAPSSRRPRQRFPAGVLLHVLCIAVTLFGLLYAARGYTILTNWQDGHEKDFLGDPVGAIICYKKALRVDPTLRNTHLFIGESLYASGRVRAAIPELQAAANGKEGDADAYALLGDAYQSLNLLDQAIVEYKQASTLAPSDAGYQLVLGVCLEKLHRWTEATNAYEMALRVEPSYALAHIRLGILLVNSGRLEEGVAHCKRAVTLAPRSVLAHNTLGTAYAQCRQYGDARAEYRIAVELNPQFLVGHFNLGTVLEKMNLPEQALAHYKDCMRIAADEKQEKQDDEEKSLIVRAQSEITRLEAHKKTSAASAAGDGLSLVTPRSGK